MTRIKRGVFKRARKKKIIKRAKGFQSHRKTNYRAALEGVMHAGLHATRGRHERKSDFRQLWQVRINAAAREHGLSYSRLMAALRKNKIELNRKVLSELAIREPEVFAKIVKEVSGK